MDGVLVGLGNELHRINSKRADSTTGKKIVSASGLQSETAETRTARELAGMGGYLAESHLNEETFKVIHAMISESQFPCIAFSGSRLTLLYKHDIQYD